ncbi:TPR-like protein [Dioscorea alata]|uniref:TPR-like protein n=1 Tax=Dioscorea alata TaxID=55571 RepID=A0ACB7WUV5_DIOAL|nr:TPR-like protein [Dioscorea alata]
MVQELWNMNAPLGIRPSKSAPSSPIKPILRTRSESFHVAHKVPVGDTPYVKAKRVQLVDKDPEKAIALFWAAINAGDRVDSALKDMAIVMKQQNRAEEAIEAIKSLRNRCSDQAQESLDNILLDLYKRCGRLDDQISLLKHKLHLIQQGLAFNGKRTKTARSQGRKFQVSLEQEATRLLGNLGWALMQKDEYMEAEAAYRRALLIGPDNNKMCNLGICLMKQGRVAEAKDTLKQVKRPVNSSDGLRGADSHLKAFERAQEMLRDIESKILTSGGARLFEAFTGSSSIWQPQPCNDYQMPLPEFFPDENAAKLPPPPPPPPQTLLPCTNLLNIDAPPFYLNSLKSHNSLAQCHDPLGNLKRTRSGNMMEEKKATDETVNRKKSALLPELPDNDAFNEAILAAVLAPVLEDAGGETSNKSPALAGGKMGKRLRVFQDITLSLRSSSNA